MEVQQHLKLDSMDKSDSSQDFVVEIYEYYSLMNTFPS